MTQVVTQVVTQVMTQVTTQVATHIVTQVATQSLDFQILLFSCSNLSLLKPILSNIAHYT